MRGTLLLLLPLALLCLSVNSDAQLWSGIISPTRAIDWTQAGIPGGIPDANWTQCGSTIAAYSGSASTITSQLAKCGANQFVQLGPGTFTLTGSIVFPTTGNVVLRGMGPDTTFIVPTSVSNCSQAPYPSPICV
jgi:hypothetical protein